ncbi:MAG: murein biosynthesis integral rane protein MurJ [Actinomycetota bacterium]|jgi:putative peptidoglycan lipid II flippase
MHTVSEDSGLLRNSALMAAGTVTSRITGVIRDMAMTAALGFFIVSDAFSLGNTLPNIIYILVAGGTLNAVFIPQLVRHMRDDADNGKAFSDRLLSVVGTILLALSALSVLAAPLIVGLYATSTMPQAEFDLAVAFARLCLPQIFFYGAYTMLQQVLNARGKFAAAFFAPVANNLVAIVVFISFLVVVQPNADNLTQLTSGQIWWLGLGSTLGVALQALILFPALLRSGYKFSFRTDWKNSGLGHSARLAKWTIYLVIANQIAFAIITRLATQANVAASKAGEVAIGLTSYQKANLIFILPHSVITISLVTALLPQLSRLSHEENFSELGKQVSRATRLVLSLLIPIAGLLAITGQNIAVLLFGNGVAGAEAANAVGVIVALFAFGLPAYSVIYVLNRAWFAMEDTRTPFWIAVGVNVIMLIAAVPLFMWASVNYKVAMFGIGYSIAYVVMAILAWWYLNRQITTLESSTTLLVTLKLFISAMLATMVCGFVQNFAPATPTQLQNLVIVLGLWLLGGVSFVAIANLLRIDEVSQGIRLISARLRRS